MNINTLDDYNRGISHLELLTHGCIDEAYEDEIGDLLTKLDKFEEENPELIAPLPSLEEVENMFYQAINRHLTC